VGGWVTDNFSWHYIFYMNVLIGPIAVVIQLVALDAVPARWGELLKADWIGIGFMAVGLPLLTFVLEEGQRKDWFDSPTILNAAIIGIMCVICCVIRELLAKRPFINLRVLANRSVGSACFLMTVGGSVSYGAIYIIPVYCAQIQGYNPQQIGYVVMWSGLPQIALMPVMPLLMRIVDTRLLVIIGTLFYIASCWINVGLTHDVGMGQLILPQLLRAMGQPLFTIPLSQLATVGLAPRDTADASALSNMMRNLGGSIGIAMLSTIVERREHFHFSMLAEAITVNATRTQERLSTLAASMHAHVTDPVVAKAQALARLAAQVRQEAYVMAYADGFYLVGVSLVLSLGAVAILRKPQKARSPVETR
jgi:DHA2 family multidrug resistance protein